MTGKSVTSVLPHMFSLPAQIWVEIFVWGLEVKHPHVASGK